MNKTMSRRIVTSSIAFVFFFLLAGSNHAENPKRKEVNILVIAIYGVETAVEEWQPTIDYLQSSLPQYEFKLIPVKPIELERIKEMERSNQAALKAGFQAWTFPYDYQPVHELMKELHIGPYKDYGKITVRGFIAQHMIETIILIALATMVLLMTILLYRSNISLSKDLYKPNK